MKRLLPITMVCLMLVLLTSGCGPSQHDKAKSQVGVAVHLEFNERNFPNGGKLSEKDPWGHELIWVLEKGVFYYTVTVRSCGPDGLPFTDDDIIAKRDFSIAEISGEGLSERFARGLTRGWVKGIREGLKDPLPPKDKK